MEFNYQDIKRLAEILRPTEEESESEDDLPQSGLSALGNVIKHGKAIGLCWFELMFLYTLQFYSIFVVMAPTLLIQTSKFSTV